MVYLWKYITPEPFDDMFLNSDGEFLTGLWFSGSRDTSKHNLTGTEEFLPVFQDTVRWLDLYFAGKEPDFTPKYRVQNLTPFRQMVIDAMNRIPYGQVVTYADIAAEIAEKKGIRRMSAQAVGGAVGWNPICLIIPCHRVVGSNGSLTGYGGGIRNKEALLKLEGLPMEQFYVPTKGTAL